MVPVRSLFFRHVSWLRRLGATKFFMGCNSYWSPYSTNHRNHRQRHYYENEGTKESCELSEQKNFWFVSQLWHSGYTSCKWSQTIKLICLGAKWQFGEIAPVYLPGYVTALVSRRLIARSTVVRHHLHNVSFLPVLSSLVPVRDVYSSVGNGQRTFINDKGTGGRTVGMRYRLQHKYLSRSKDLIAFRSTIQFRTENASTPKRN